MIRLDRVTKTYVGSEQPALSGVDLVVDDDEFVFLVGRSGSGKSTLLRLLMRQDVPDSGLIEFDGRDVVRMSRQKHIKYLRNIGYVPQRLDLEFRKTAFEIIADPMRKIKKSERAINRVVPEVLDLVGLDMKAYRKISELSAGERQRVALGHAFVNRPKLLLADEPTHNVDPDTSQGIVRLLERMNRAGTAVLMATTNKDVVDVMLRRVVELELGHIVRDEHKGAYRPSYDM